MFKKKCFCGKSEKSFKKDIGTNFYDECCKEAGFDEMGNLIDPDAVVGSEEAGADMDKAASQEAVQSAENEAVDYNKMSNKALKALCLKRKLDIKGKKSNKDLVKVLEFDDKAGKSEEQAEDGVAETVSSDEAPVAGSSEGQIDVPESTEEAPKEE